MRELDFSHEDKDYKIRIIEIQGPNDTEYKIKAFLNGRAVNGYTHSVHLQTALDLKAMTGIDAIKMLIDDVKQDIIEQRWEKLQEILRQKSKN